MRNRFLKIAFLFCLFSSVVRGNEEIAESANILEQTTDRPLFVSLGGTCTAASMLRYFGLRNAAFPFDWMLTTDDVEFIELLDNDFDLFLNRDLLVMHPMRYGHLVHSIYHVEFAHDWDATYWENQTLLDEAYGRLRSKFEKRISRFRDLVNYKGKVVFVRIPIFIEDFIAERPTYFWYDSSHVNNEKTLALQLHKALKNLFPRLDFSLLIVRKSDVKNVIRLSDNIVQYSIPNLELHQDWKTILEECINKS